MNIAEANLMLGSLDDLSRTLLANKLEKQRKAEAGRRFGLEEQTLGMRREDMASDRAFKEREVAAREGAAKSLDQYHKDMLGAKTDDQKFQIFTDMVKAGAVTPQSLDAMSKAMSQKLGVDVQLKLPEKPGFDTREGHNLALAERYRERANAARRNGAGDEADRFMAIADRLERGGQPESEPMAELTEEVGALDPLTGKGEATVRRKVPADKLDEMLKARTGGVPGAAALGKPAGAPANQFETVAQAHEAGKKAGDVILLYDPAQKRYRKFQLE